MQSELTIGEFSRVSHLSVKTLRHYHDVGLLDPDSVNPSNGYRYYSASQVPTAHVIRRLRDLDMPVADVKALLATDDAAQRNAGELHATVDARDVEATGPGGGLYASEIFQHDRGDATVYIPVRGNVRAIGRVQPLVVPAAELAVVVHHGALDDIDVTYGALGSYATRHELSIEAPLRETYLCDTFDTPDPRAWKTEIGWPILRADADL